MRLFWRYTYSLIVIPLLWILLQLFAVFNSKVRRGIRGRRGFITTLQQQVDHLMPGKRVWFHSSSMGEFEQAKPMISELKKRDPTVNVITTFFSPSGYEHSRKYHLADVISYLPFDSTSGARRFLDLIQPDAAVMVRYDVWPNHIWELQRRQIPTFIANATMRERSKRRLPVVSDFHHHVYDAIDHILTVSQNDVEAFRIFALKHSRVEAIGDTRYDQVSARSIEAKKRQIIPPSITKGKKVLVVGSSWPEDEQIVVPAFLKLRETLEDLLLIIVPHEPTVEHIEELEAVLPADTPSIRFSGLNEYAAQRVIIVDSIGILLTLYAYAHIAYVGGSFRQGVHNVLEAAVFGVPVVFGPRYRNSEEPLMLVNQGGGFVVSDIRDLHRTLANLLTDEVARSTAGERAAQFVRSNVGATERFLQRLEPYLKG